MSLDIASHPLGVKFTPVSHLLERIPESDGRLVTGSLRTSGTLWGSPPGGIPWWTLSASVAVDWRDWVW